MTTHSVFEDVTSGGQVKKLAKQFGGVSHPDHPNKFAIPYGKVDAFHAAANKAGSFLKHKSPTGVYHYRSAGHVGADGQIVSSQHSEEPYGHVTEDRAREIIQEKYSK
jgi:hypothetical protein